MLKKIKKINTFQNKKNILKNNIYHTSKYIFRVIYLRN
jgi:hypothetical protein